jgi:hypothetical protein
MVLSRSGPVPMRWLWCVLVCVSLSACSTPYHFRYQYTLVDADGSSDGIDNERLRVRVIPTDEVGVLQLAVMNKSAQPLTIVWTRTQYIDPLGHSRPAIDAGPSGLFGPPAWPAGGSLIVSGETFQARIRPGGFRSSRAPSLSPYAGQPDPRLPPDVEFQPTGRPTDRVSLNPLTVSRSTAGEVTVSTVPQPLLPTSGNTPTLGQAYRGREFRFVLTLLLDTGMMPYTFTFRITDVAVQAGASRTE